jgi:hypothetical protein
VDLDDAPAADFAASARERAKKKRGKTGRAKPREVEEPLDVDDGASADASGEAEEEAPRRKKSAAASADSAPFDADDPGGTESSDGAEAEESSEPRTAEARGWAASDATAAEEDDGRASFLSGDGGGESGGDVGVDDETSAEENEPASADPTVVLGLNAGFVRRTLGYSDDIYGRLRAPNANSWVYRLEAAVYPFARPVKNRIGLIAGYESEFSGVVRDNAAGTDFGVTFAEVFGGVRLRQPLGKHEVSLEGTFGSLQAGLDDPDGTSGVPQFDYTSLRAALNVGLHFGDVALRGAVGYRLPIGGYGQASDADWFPRMEGYGMEGSLGLEYRFTKEVAFDVAGSMRRFLLQMNSQPADALAGQAEVAGGAVDLYLGGYFGLNITL